MLAPDLDPELIRLILGRGTYGAREEEEAETLASLILRQPGNLAGSMPAAAYEDARVLGRLQTVTGWAAATIVMTCALEVRETTAAIRLCRISRDDNIATDPGTSPYAYRDHPEISARAGYLREIQAELRGRSARHDSHAQPCMTCRGAVQASPRHYRDHGLSRGRA